MIYSVTFIPPFYTHVIVTIKTVQCVGGPYLSVQPFLYICKEQLKYEE
jgi:hypothetical protein